MVWVVILFKVFVERMFFFFLFVLFYNFFGLNKFRVFKAIKGGGVKVGVFKFFVIKKDRVLRN